MFRRSMARGQSEGLPICGLEISAFTVLPTSWGLFDRVCRSLWIKQMPGEWQPRLFGVPGECPIRFFRREGG
jgi:hypothetical protein